MLTYSHIDEEGLMRIAFDMNRSSIAGYTQDAIIKKIVDEIAEKFCVMYGEEILKMSRAAITNEAFVLEVQKEVAVKLIKDLLK